MCQTDDCNYHKLKHVMAHNHLLGKLLLAKVLSDDTFSAWVQACKSENLTIYHLLSFPLSVFSPSPLLACLFGKLMKFVFGRH